MLRSPPPLHLLSEAMIQAEFYACCRSLDLPCILELNTPAGVLDCAIFSPDWSHVLAIVETKKRDRFGMGQIGRYKRIGVPVFGLCFMDRAERLARLAKQIKRDYLDNPKHQGVTLEQVRTMERLVRGKCLRKRAFSPLDLDESIIYRE